MVVNSENLRHRFDSINPSTAQRLQGTKDDPGCESLEGVDTDCYYHPSFQYDFGSKMIVAQDGQIVKLTLAEIPVFERLLKSPNQLVSSSDFINTGLVISDNYLSVHISRLRKKIEPDSPIPQIIMTAWGNGYYLADPSKRLSIDLDLSEKPQQADFYHHRLFTYNYKGKCVDLGDQTVHLTPREASLLEFLLDRPNKLFESTAILESVFGQDYSPGMVKVYMRYLRRKIEPDPKSPQIFMNIHGQGYYLADPDRDPNA